MAEPEARAGSVFVGRERELAELVAGLDDALEGHGHLYLLAGEPGIGKSRLAAELATIAGQRGVMLLWGRCWEAGGAPAYWPWVQSIRSYVREADPESLRTQLAGGAPEVAQMIPEVRDLFEELPAPPSLDPEGARFRLFDQATTFLRNASASTPLMFVLEDLHAADEPSLLLLRFLARELGRARILVIGTYRDVEVGKGTPLESALGELIGEPTTRQILLRGLDLSEVRRYIEATSVSEPSEALVAAVHDGTEGNPLFVGEVVRLLATDGRLADVADVASLRPAISEGVRAVIGRRLGLLSEDCRHLLGLGAVLGIEFGLDELERVSDRPAEELFAVLEEARTARLVTEISGAIGRERFSHGLVREVVYDDLSAAERLRLHRITGEVLEGLHESDLESRLAEIAHHFFESLPGGDVDKAIDYARRAGDRATALLAYEEAVRLYRMALQALELRDRPDDLTRIDLMLALGDTLWRAGDEQRGRETLLRAADRARISGSSEQLGRAAILYGGRFIWLRAGNDRHIIPLLQDAIATLGEQDSALRVRLMSRLAGTLRGRLDRETGARLIEDAIRMAERLEDPPTMMFALTARLGVLWWPENPEQRLKWANEVVRLAANVDDREREMEGHYSRFVCFMELGRLADALGELETMNRLEQDVRQPSQRWLLASTDVMLAGLQGRSDEAEGLIENAVRIGGSAQQTDSQFARRLQLYMLSLHAGTLEDVEAVMAASVEEFHWYPVFRSFLAHLYAELGKEAEALRVFEGLATRDFADIPRDNTWLLGMSLLSEVCRFLRDGPRAETLYQLLSPYAALNALSHPEAATGSVARPVGILSSVLRRWEQAAAHFEAALEMNEQMGARPWLARTQYDYAQMLLDRAASGDRERAASLLADAVEACDELGLLGLRERIDELLGERPVPKVQALALSLACLFHREGEYWSISFDGEEFRLRDSKGLRYLAQLLMSPGRELHVLDLVASVHGVSAERGRSDERMTPAGDDAGAILDPQAKAAYRHRVQDLEEELAEAESWNDPERAARARQEMDFLTSELARAVGLGSRDRKAASSSERARVNVTRAVKSVLARIDEHSPALGLHLAATVRTGTFCSYRPDPRLEVSWQIS